MGIVNKILGKEEKEEKKDTRQIRDQARRDRIKAPTPAKTSIIEKIRSKKQAETTQKPQKMKAIRAAKKQTKAEEPRAKTKK